MLIALIGINWSTGIHVNNMFPAQALDVLQRMRDDTNVELDAISYSSSIIACARGGCCKEGLQLLEEMQSAGYQPSSYTYR